MATVTTGLFDSPADAARAIDALAARGVPTEDISLVASDRVDKSTFGVRTQSKMPEGAAIGGGAGGAIGALVAGFTAVGAVATGGAGLLVAGPIVAALAGGGAGAAAGMGIGALIGAAIPEHEVKHYQDALDKGAVLVGVNRNGTVTKETVRDVFQAHHASKISNA